MSQVTFHEEYVTLNQFLKIAGIAMTGGQGKAMILNGEVCVNGEKELRRGRKIRNGDVVTVQGMQESWEAVRKESE